MNGINTSVNNAVNSYRRTYCGFKTAAFNTKSQARQFSSEETTDIWKKSYDGFEKSPQAYGRTNQNYNNSRYANNASNAGCSQNKCGWVNRRKYDGFDSYYTGAYNNRSEKPANTDKVNFSIIESEEESKKAKELADAYAYFRKAAKYNGYTVVQSGSESSLYSYAIMSGKKSVIMIDPEFMNTIKDDPEMLKKYADEIENMKKLDKQFERSCKQQGKTVVSRGWRIEKDGSISSWSVVKTERKAQKGNLERMREMQEKILKKKTKQKKEQAKLEEKRSRKKEELLRLEGKKKSAMKENIKRKIKKSKVYEFNRITPKSNPNKTISSISVSCGSSPSLLKGTSKNPL